MARVQKYIHALEFLDARIPVQAEELVIEIERIQATETPLHCMSFLRGVRFAEFVQGFGRSMEDYEE